MLSERAKTLPTVEAAFTWVRNNVTGGIVKMQWSAAGRLLVMNVDPHTPQPSEFGDLARNSYLGNSTTDYSIKNGKILTSFGNQTFETAVYKLGDRYLAARSNEFGYANYEIIATPDNLSTDVKSAGVSR